MTRTPGFLDRIRHMPLHNMPEIVVLAIAAGGLGFSALVPEHWLRGVLVMSGALLVAGVVRMLLTDEQAGLLAVRGRVVDVLCYFGIAFLIIFFGLVLPRTS